MFKKVPTKVDFPRLEHRILDFWQETNAFQKLWKKNKGNSKYSFIDGPITANNPMGVHHAWGRTYKDLFQRYQAMRGRDLRYQNGFDCQGLWIEVEVEKELGFESKADIEKYGLAEFVRRCKERVLKFSATQTEQSIRMGYWMDWNDTDLLRDLAAKMAQDPQQTITVPGPLGPVSALFHRTLAARDRHRGLPRTDSRRRNRHLSAAGAPRRAPAGLDHHALDADQQRFRLRASRSDLRQG